MEEVMERALTRLRYFLFHPLYPQFFFSSDGIVDVTKSSEKRREERFVPLKLKVHQHSVI